MPDPLKKTLEELRETGAPDFFERNTETIKARLVAAYERIADRKLYPAQTEMFLIDMLAYVLANMAEAEQTAVLQNTIVWAEGRHLEDRAANNNTFRLKQQPSQCVLEFGLAFVSANPIHIPAGTRVTAGNDFIFATQADLTIETGKTSATGLAICHRPGSFSNDLQPGSINQPLDPVHQLVTKVENITTSSGGTDEEDQERFRLRAANALYKIAKTGPANGYREHVMAVNPKIIDVSVHRPEPGRIEIYPLMVYGQPGDELIAYILAYLDPETLRPMGDDLVVLAPVRRGFAITVTVKTEIVVGDLEARLHNIVGELFFNWSRELGQQISASEIIRQAKQIAEIRDVKIDGLDFVDLPHNAYPDLDKLTINQVVVANV